MANFCACEPGHRLVSDRVSHGCSALRPADAPAGGGLAFVMYIISPAAIPPGHARYLIGINIALPALIYPFWSAGSSAYRGSQESRRLWRRVVGYWGCLGLVTLTLMGGVVSTYTLTPAAHVQS